MRVGTKHSVGNFKDYQQMIGRMLRPYNWLVVYETPYRISLSQEKAIPRSLSFPSRVAISVGIKATI
jgi:hypothetical protein